MSHRTSEEEALDKYRRAVAGKPYRPSNGSEGEMFQARWCYQCERDLPYQRGEMIGGWEVEGCPIIAASMCFDVGHPDYPKEWVHDDEGYPVCTAFVEEGKPIPDPPDPNQLPLFEEES